MLRSDKHEMTSLPRSGRCWADWRLPPGRSMVVAALTLLAAPSQTAFGATLRATPHAGVTETYTDNVQSVSEGAEADLITQTEAGVNLAAEGARLDLNLDLSAVHDYFLDTDGLSGVRPKALGSGEVELLEDHFFIASRVSLSETSTQRDGARAATDRSLSSNRAQLLLYEVSPRFVTNFGRMLEATLEYRRSESRYSNPSTGISPVITAAPGVLPGFPDQNQLRNQNEKTDDISFLLDTGKYFSKTNSQFELSKTTSKGRTRGSRTEDRIELANEYQVTRQLALIARAGYEDLGDANSTLSNRGATGAVGFHLKPGPRLDFRTEFGRKYGDKNVSADLTYKISSFYVLNASFEQSIQTQTSSRLNQLNRLAVGPDGRLVDPFSGVFRNPGDSNFDLNNSSFREDLFQLGLTGTRGRNTINLSADLSSRDSGQNTVKRDELDINLNLSRRLWPQLRGSLGLGYSDTLNGGQTAVAGVGSPVGLRANRSGEEYQGDANLEYRLGESLFSNLSYNYLKRMNTFTGDVSENVVSIGINAQF